MKHLRGGGHFEDGTILLQRVKGRGVRDIGTGDVYDCDFLL